MVDTCYDICQAKQEITNTKCTDQGADSPRWIQDFGAVCKTDVITYHEWDVWAGGPSLTNEFEVIEDDLVKKY